MLSDGDKQWIGEQLEHVETRLLRAFQRCASPVELRVRSQAAALRAMDVGMESLAQRVKKLEG